MLIKARVKGNKRGQSNFFNNGKLVAAGEIVEVSVQTFEAHKDQLDRVGSVEDPGVRGQATADAGGTGAAPDGDTVKGQKPSKPESDKEKK